MRGGADFDEAFPELYRAARGLAWRLLGDEAMADDVAAEALARALVRWSTLRHQSYVTAWVLKVASNLALDELRRRARHRERGRAIRDPFGATADDELVVLRHALVAAIEGLSRRQREAVVLVHVAGLSPGDAARSMGVSPSSLSAHLRRGLAALRRALGDDGFSSSTLEAGS